MLVGTNPPQLSLMDVCKYMTTVFEEDGMKYKIHRNSKFVDCFVLGLSTLQEYDWLRIINGILGTGYVGQSLGRYHP